MLVGNKSDLESSRKTPRDMAERFAQEEGLLFSEASAKSGEGVEDLFMEIGEFVVIDLVRDSMLMFVDDSEEVAVGATGPTVFSWDERGKGSGCVRAGNRVDHLGLLVLEC